MVRRGSVGSASACWKAGPSSVLGSAPQEGFSPCTEHKCNEEMERGLGEWRWVNVWYHCMNVIWNACIEKVKINKKCGNRHQTFKKDNNCSLKIITSNNNINDDTTKIKTSWTSKIITFTP